MRSSARSTVDERGPTSGIELNKTSVVIAVAVLLIIALGVGAYLYFIRSRSGAINSIAVLPLVNASNNPDTEYLADGISESLINSLTELQQLRVVARATAFRYKGREADPQAVGRELKVRTVLMGKVRQMGDRLNIQVDLVDTSTGTQLWGEEYERRVEDVLTVKQAIARAVTDKLRLKLSGEQQQQLVKRDTANAEAYQFYLRGRYYWNKPFADGLRKAIAEFEQAVERDPTYALGYVGLADCYAVLEQYAGIPGETLPKAKAYAERALQIDESMAEAHASMANIYTTLWQWGEAEKEFRRAIELNPKYPTTHHWYSIYLGATGRIDEALAEANRALELDPLSMVINGNVAYFYLVKGDLDAAIERSREMVELDSSFPSGHLYLGMAYLKQGHTNEGLAETQKAVELAGRSSEFLGYLGYANAVGGKRAEAVAIIKELEGRYAARAAVGSHLALVYAGLGDKDQAFAWLEKDFQARGNPLSSSDVNTFPAFESLRSDPRYADLLRRMGLEP